MRDLTIEPYNYNPATGLQDEYAVYEHGEYPHYSVLAGQYRRSFVDSGTLEEMKEKYPEAEVKEFSTKVSVTMSETPPDWFDPMDAGEVWHEDDY